MHGLCSDKVRVICQSTWGPEITRLCILVKMTVTLSCYSDPLLLMWPSLATVTLFCYNDPLLLQWLSLSTVTLPCWSDPLLLQWIELGTLAKNSKNGHKLNMYPQYTGDPHTLCCETKYLGISIYAWKQKLFHWNHWIYLISVLSV